MGRGSMRRKAGLGLAASLMALGAAASPPASAQDRTWRCDRSPLTVTNATLWNEGRPLRRREIVIADGRIVAIGQAGRLRRPAGGRLIDAGGGWLLPGLIDSHVH